MGKEFTKEDVISNKKEAIKLLNKLLESYINNPSEKHLKKAYLISYWLKDYVQYINFEEQFNPIKNIAYKRGDVVKLNFGFNIGSEYGGLHYAIVLDNHNRHNSPVLTVIPLTSAKEGKVPHDNNVELGSEIYKSLKLKYDTISKALKEEKKDISIAIKEFDKFDKLFNMCTKELKERSLYKEGSVEFSANSTSTQKYLIEAGNFKNVWEQKHKHNSEEQKYLKKIGSEISQMKKGSIALVNQITTVSKMRIFDPRNLKGVLSGVSLSGDSMEKINQKVKELYIF